jgi:SNF2-related domain/Helicase conserved C-terminal domain
MSDTRIEFNPANGRFEVYAPPWHVDKCRNIPNRRWNKSKSCWLAPAIRLNAMYVKATWPDAEFSPAAKVALDRALTPKLPKFDAVFPAEYEEKMSSLNHQKRILPKVWGTNVFALLWPMGTGKSKTMVDCFTARGQRNEIDRVLVICPMGAKANLKEQIELHSPGEVSVEVLTLDDIRHTARWIETSVPQEEGVLAWLVIGIESLQQSTRALAICEQFLTVGNKPGEKTAAMIVDEASKIKSHQAIRAQRCVALGKKCKYRWVMTGTPILQNLLDLFMLFEFLDPDIIGVGDFFSFKNRYSVWEEGWGGDYKTLIGYQNIDELMDLIRPFCDIIDKKEALPDLPDKIYEKRMIKMSDEQRRIYTDLLHGFEVEFENGIMDPEEILERALRRHEVVGGFYAIEEPREDLTKKKKFTKHPIKGGNPKLQALLEVVEEVEGSVIIWCKYRAEIALVVDELERLYPGQTVEYHGGVSEEDRTRARMLFQQGKKRFFIATQQSGGMSLTLTAAKTVIYYSNTFALEDRLQSEDRAHRKGQTNHVLYVDLVMTGTIDEDIIKALTLKQNLAEYVKARIRGGETKILS